MRDPLFFRMFGYDPSLVPNRFVADLDRGVTNTRDAEKISGATIGYPGWGVLYHVLLSHLRPEAENVIVETGSNVGCSSIILAQALKDSGRAGVVHTIEIDPATAEKARANIKAAGVEDRIILHLGDATNVLPGLLADIPKVRLAFLDGSHLMEDVLAEFALVESKLDKGGLILMDNTYRIAEPHEDQRVHGAIPEIKRRWGGNFINLEFVSWWTPGLALWQRETFTLA